MSLQDIADYLGLTIETVSRTITQLEKDAAIRLPSSRRIELRNRAALGRRSTVADTGIEQRPTLLSCPVMQCRRMAATFRVNLSCRYGW